MVEGFVHRDSAVCSSRRVGLQKCFVMEGQGSLGGCGFTLGERAGGEGEEQEATCESSPFPHGTQKLD